MFSSSTDLDCLVEKNTKEIKKILQRIDSLVIGPGAGRNPAMLKTLSNIIEYAIEKDMPLVIDGDGLWVLTENPSLLTQYDCFDVFMIGQETSFSPQTKWSLLDYGIRQWECRIILVM